MFPIISRIPSKFLGITNRALPDLTPASHSTPAFPHYTQCSATPNHSSFQNILTYTLTLSLDCCSLDSLEWPSSHFHPQNMPPLTWNSAQMPLCTHFQTIPLPHIPSSAAHIESVVPSWGLSQYFIAARPCCTVPTHLFKHICFPV